MSAGASMTDFSRHNEEVRQVWASYDAGRPLRVPFGRLTIGPRIWVLDPALNSAGMTWEAMSNDPRLMFDTCLAYKHHLVHAVPHDIEMGVPSGPWEICTEFVNVTEEAWLGCELRYPEGQVTATVPRYTGSRKNEIFDRGIPGPFDGILARVQEYHEYFMHRARTEEFHGRPVKVLPPCPLGTDGILTVGIGGRGSGSNQGHRAEATRTTPSSSSPRTSTGKWCSRTSGGSSLSCTAPAPIRCTSAETCSATCPRSRGS